MVRGGDIHAHIPASPYHPMTWICLQDDNLSPGIRSGSLLLLLMRCDNDQNIPRHLRLYSWPREREKRENAGERQKLASADYLQLLTWMTPYRETHLGHKISDLTAWSPSVMRSTNRYIYTSPGSRRYMLSPHTTYLIQPLPAIPFWLLLQALPLARSSLLSVPSCNDGEGKR